MFTCCSAHSTTDHIFRQPLYSIFHIFLDISQDRLTRNGVEVQLCTCNFLIDPRYISKLVSQQIIPISTVKISFGKTSISVFFRSHTIRFRGTGNDSISILDTIPAENPITQVQIHIGSRSQLSHHIMDFLCLRATHYSQVRPSIFIHRIGFTVSGIESISEPFKVHLFTAKAKHGFQTCFIHKSVFRRQKGHRLRFKINTSRKTGSYQAGCQTF